jgi:hypothetical protein
LMAVQTVYEDDNLRMEEDVTDSNNEHVAGGNHI